MESIERRRFIQGAGALGGAMLFGGPLAGLAGAAKPGPGRGGSILEGPAAQAPIDTVVVLMMENRSFDHYFGWLAHDDEYLEAGRRRFGRGFRVNGDQSQAYRDAEGRRVETYHLPTHPGEDNPYRGCNHPDPGHGWNAGRAQRDHGFLHEDSGNDPFALGYYRAEDVPFYSSLVKRFTTFDRYHCSLLAPTYPNRQYLHSAQSGGRKSNEFPVIEAPFFEFDTIWDRLAAANVPNGYYFVDLPSTGFWGPRMLPLSHHIERYFFDAALGRLPNVTFLDPGFTTGLRTDDHPYADIRAGQNLVFDYVKAFVESPHWERGMFVITYDEWGGFFDHVAPPRLPDDRANARNDEEDFAQAGFRVPTIVASPYAREGFVDHRLYDHTSILRFIEWRFLGAPPEGPGGNGWWLTKRDRHAQNIGASLRASKPNPEIHLEALPKIPFTSMPCEGEELEGTGISVALEDQKHAFERSLEEGLFERAGFKIDLKPIPTL